MYSVIVKMLQNTVYNMVLFLLKIYMCIYIFTEKIFMWRSPLPVTHISASTHKTRALSNSGFPRAKEEVPSHEANPPTWIEWLILVGLLAHK